MIKISNLYKKFNLEDGLFAKYGRFVYAVNGVSITIATGETYGLVGESGCGKSTLSRMIAGIYQANSGTIEFESNTADFYHPGHEKDSSRKRELRSLIRYIFQDPAKSLDPRMSILKILLEGYRYSGHYKGKEEAIEQAKRIIVDVGLSIEDLYRKPSEFSGGQRQRISIARALITRPEVLLCDEVVSALDVSVQSQIINLLLRLKEEYKITIIFVSHDLSIVSYMSDRVGVMYAGVLMEEADSITILKKHKHPYTKLLYSSKDNILGNDGKGEVANVTEEISGCPFYSRCSIRNDRCISELPMLKEISAGHKVACFAVNSD